MDNQKLLAGFIESLKLKNYSIASLQSYAYCVDKFFRYLDGKKRLQDVTPEDLLEYSSSLKAQNYSPYTVERIMNSLKSFFRYLEENFYVLVNPAEKLKLCYTARHLPQVLSESETELLLKQPNINKPGGIRDRAILETFYATGIRLSELHNLNLENIDLENQVLRVNNGKGGKDRVVPLTQAACQWLKEYLASVRPRFVKNNAQEPALFLGERGLRLHKLLHCCPN